MMNEYIFGLMFGMTIKDLVFLERVNILLMRMSSCSKNQICQIYKIAFNCPQEEAMS